MTTQRNAARKTETVWEKTSTSGLYTRKGREGFFARITINGKRTFRSLKTSKLREAQKLIKELQIGFVRDVSTRGAETLHAALADTIEFRKIRKLNNPIKPRTEKFHADLLKDAQKLIADLPLQHVTEKDLLSIISRCKFGTSRKKAIFELVKGTLKRAAENGAIRLNPLAGHIFQQTPVKKRELPTREQLDNIIAKIPELFPRYGHRAALSVRFLAYSGMRISEATAVKWSDIRGGRIYVSESKTGERTLDINPPLQQVIDDIASIYGSSSDDLVIPAKNIRLQIQTTCRDLGYHHLDHHDLRAWFITWAINAGIDVKTIADWVGNSPAVLLTRYASIQSEIKKQHAAKLS